MAQARQQALGNLTKDEFDGLFLDKKVCIHHNTYEQWEKIVQYLEKELGLEPAGSVFDHDFKTFPYTHLSGRIIFSNCGYQGEYQVIPFEQFWDAVNSSEPELQCSLEEVL